jgi:two-component sensor histidine kinase
MLKPLDDGLGTVEFSAYPGLTRPLEAEADHRIANSLALVSSLLKTQAREVGARRAFSGAEARALLEASAARIDAVAHLHRLLAHASAQPVDVAAYLTNLAEAAASFAAAEGAVRTIYEFGAQLALDGRRLSMLGLFAGEALVNAYKHAHPANAPGEIRLCCRQIDAVLALVIEDDGVGLPEGFDPNRDGGIGFKVMAALAEQLKATVTRKSTPLGLWTEILVPL